MLSPGPGTLTMLLSSSWLPSTSFVITVTHPGSVAVIIDTLADEEAEAEKGEPLA